MQVRPKTLDPATEAAIAANRSALLWQLGPPQAALAAIKLAIAANPKSAVNWANQGSIFMALAQPEAAAKAYQTATRLDPANGYAWTGQGVALAKLGQSSAALVAIEKALQLDPTQPLALKTQATLRPTLAGLKTNPPRDSIGPTLTAPPSTAQSKSAPQTAISPTPATQPAPAVTESLATIGKTSPAHQSLAIELQRLIAPPAPNPAPPQNP